MKIEPILYTDSQLERPAGHCEVCGGELYRPRLICQRCFRPLKELSQDYEAAAQPLRLRLRELRQALSEAKDAEEIWHIKRRIAELTPMLTQMNELAELTAHYYERGYWRNEKYTL